jgi:hypothetical protein
MGRVGLAAPVRTTAEEGGRGFYPFSLLFGFTETTLGIDEDP